jgi:asparagine N-glycosylation enzyme membrane subunit Stt3
MGRQMAASMTRAGLAGAAVLAGGVALLVSPEALLEVSLLGVNGFHVGSLVMLSVFAGALLAWDRFPVMGRAGPGLHVAAAAIGCGALVLVLPPFRQPVMHGLTALGAASSWHRNIQEFDPMFFAGYQSLRREAAVALSLLGLTLPLTPVALVALARRRPPRSIGVARWSILLWLGLSLIPLALVRRRFLVYAAVPLALWSASLAVTLARRATPHRTGGFAPLVALSLLLAMLAPTWTWLARDRRGEDPGPERRALLEAATWLRGQDPAQPRSPAVFAEWDFGHVIQYLSRKPVLVSPFGTDVGDAPMTDFARAFLTESPDTLEAVMGRRRVGFVVLVNPVTEAHFAAAYLPSGTPEYVTVRRDWRTGLDVTLKDPFWNTASSRLFFEDGAGRGGEALSPLRLVFEAGAPEVWEGREVPAIKVFERVNAARLVVGGAAPGSPVTVELALVAPTGRTTRWSSTAVSDSAGTALLRVPYAAGLNRTTYATEIRARSGSRVATVAVSDDDVREGRRLEVRLPPR